MRKLSLKDTSTRAPKDFEKDTTKKKTSDVLNKLDDLQNLLFAEGKHSVLVVMQGMDASGKDGVIRNVFGVLNPQGVTVKSFKAPTAEELSRDFLWRVHSHAPGKGVIQIFNRSHCNKIPWTIVPADQNWYKEFIIATALYELLKGLDMKYPGLKKETRRN